MDEEGADRIRSVSGAAEGFPRGLLRRCTDAGRMWEAADRLTLCKKVDEGVEWVEDSKLRVGWREWKTIKRRVREPEPITHVR